MPQTIYLSKTQEDIIKYLLRGEMERLKWEVNECQREYCKDCIRDADELEEYRNLDKCYSDVKKLWKKMYGDDK